MQPARTMMAVAKTGCAAADGTSTRLCQTFIAEPMLFSDDGDNEATAMLVKTAGEKLVINQSLSEIAPGDVVQIVQDIGGFWMVISGGSVGSQVIEFVFPDLEYPESLPENCDEREPLDTSTFVVKVVKVRCGGTRPVYGEDSQGYVEVVDSLGKLQGIDYRAIPGKRGIAVLLKREVQEASGDYYELGPDCEWVIVNVHLYIEEHFIRDIIISGNKITIERAKGKFIDYCITGTEVIEGIDCEEVDYSYGGGI